MSYFGNICKQFVSVLKKILLEPHLETKFYEKFMFYLQLNLFCHILYFEISLTHLPSFFAFVFSLSKSWLICELPDVFLFNRSYHLGKELRHQLLKVQQQFPDIIKEVRGRGLFNAVEFNSKTLSPVSAYDICLKLKERGVLAKPTHDTIVRLTPPLSIR